LLLELEVLGREKHPLSPNHSMAIFHEGLELLTMTLEDGGDFLTEWVTNLAHAV